MSFVEPCRVVVGVGDLQDGVRALRWGLAEAHRRRARLHAVRAWRDVRQPGPLGGEVPRFLQAEAEQLLATAFSIATGGVAPEFGYRLSALPGWPAEVLAGYADRDDDLLVVGAARHGAWRLFGQRTVYHCMRKARCPVVVVPPTALARSMPLRKLRRELRRDLEQWKRYGMTWPSVPGETRHPQL